MLQSFCNDLQLIRKSVKDLIAYLVQSCIEKTLKVNNWWFLEWKQVNTGKEWKLTGKYWQLKNENGQVNTGKEWKLTGQYWQTDMMART